MSIIKGGTKIKINMNIKSINIIIISLMVVAIISCSDHLTEGLEANNPKPDKERVEFDNEALYRLQTDKSYILTNQIRCRSGRFILDISRGDAEMLGIDENLYKNVINQVEIINNTNLKLKGNETH